MTPSFCSRRDKMLLSTLPTTVGVSLDHRCLGMTTCWRESNVGPRQIKLELPKKHPRTKDPRTDRLPPFPFHHLWDALPRALSVVLASTIHRIFAFFFALVVAISLTAFGKSSPPRITCQHICIQRHLKHKRDPNHHECQAVINL